jgi:putative ABC transport system permease protein
MALPLRYNVRNVFVRWRTTATAVLSIALVICGYLMMQGIPAGLQKSSANTGDPRNVMVVRKGSTSESSSQVTREQFRLIPYLPEVAKDSEGRPLASADTLVLISLPRRDGKGEANVSLRGLSPIGMQLRPQVSLADGEDRQGNPTASRWFTPGKREVVVSRRLARRFANFDIGNSFQTSGQQLTVVGWMDGGNSAFDSEIWMDSDEARSTFDRDHYSSALVRLAEGASLMTFTNRIETDKRLPLRADLEVKYYAAQTQTAGFFRIMGNFLATMMSFGAMFAAMNTMYAVVGARTREIGTLRVLGYRRRSILVSFVIEGAFLAFLGGVLGGLMALGLNAINLSFGTMGFETFSEVVVRFRLTPGLAVKGLIFSVIVGVLGSLLPAIRASRLPVISALKAV